MAIKIVLPEGSAPKVANGTKVYTQDGEEIKGITRIQIDFRPDSVLTATLTVMVEDIENAEFIEEMAFETGSPENG